MSKAYEIELSAPVTSRCECCGGLIVRLTRFVCREGDAFAVYYATYTNEPSHDELAMLVSLGDWGEEADPSKRCAFYCRVRPTDGSYEVMLGDAAESVWGKVEIVGEKLSREEARGHAWKNAAFEVLDEALAKDRSLTGFLHRVQCGDASVPLEKSFQSPDVIFALGDRKRERVTLGGNFASLDDARFFVRCLLPVPVEDYGSWCVGIWIEVTQSDFEHAKTLWNDPQRYPRLRFSGVVANDVGADLDLPLAPACEVQLHVTDASSPPRVMSAAAEDLAQLLSRPWPRASFEEFAVARGFL